MAVVVLASITLLVISACSGRIVGLLGGVPPGSTRSYNSPGRLSRGYPIRIKIPRVSIDAAVEYAGVTSDGSMEVPKGPDNVAWYRFGPLPGEIGSAVISGHYGWKSGIPAAFDNLHKLQVGDRVYVDDSKGVTSVFVVESVRLYGEKQGAADVFGSKDGKAHLNLITCEGLWNAATKSYSNRLVVFAGKE